MNTRANRKVQSETHTATGRHAVVLGGSLAGLLAARILADHFDRVTLLERDATLRDASPGKRRRVLYEVEPRYGRETS